MAKNPYPHSCIGSQPSLASSTHSSLPCGDGKHSCISSQPSLASSTHSSLPCGDGKHSCISSQPSLASSTHSSLHVVMASTAVSVASHPWPVVHIPPCHVVMASTAVSGASHPWLVVHIPPCHVVMASTAVSGASHPWPGAARGRVTAPSAPAPVPQSGLGSVVTASTDSQCNSSH